MTQLRKEKKREERNTHTHTHTHTHKQMAIWLQLDLYHCCAFLNRISNYELVETFPHQNIHCIVTFLWHIS